MIDFYVLLFAFLRNKRNIIKIMYLKHNEKVCTKIRKNSKKNLASYVAPISQLYTYTRKVQGMFNSIYLQYNTILSTLKKLSLSYNQYTFINTKNNSKTIDAQA